MQLKSIFVISTLFLISLTASAQINAVEKFLKENDNLSKFFIYQSTLRLLNESGDEDFNRLIKGIRKINVYITEGTTAVSSTSYQRMITDLTTEKFETLVTAKTGGTRFNLMSKETNNNSYYVLAAHEDSGFALMEMDGYLDLRYIESLENINISKLRSIVGMDDAEKTTPAEEQD